MSFFQTYSLVALICSALSAKARTTPKIQTSIDNGRDYVSTVTDSERASEKAPFEDMYQFGLDLNNPTSIHLFDHHSENSYNADDSESSFHVSNNLNSEAESDEVPWSLIKTSSAGAQSDVTDLTITPHSMLGHDDHADDHSSSWEGDDVPPPNDIQCYVFSPNSLNRSRLSDDCKSAEISRASTPVPRDDQQRDSDVFYYTDSEKLQHSDEGGQEYHLNDRDSDSDHNGCGSHDSAKCTAAVHSTGKFDVRYLDKITDCEYIKRHPQQNDANNMSRVAMKYFRTMAFRNRQYPIPWKSSGELRMINDLQPESSSVMYAPQNNIVLEVDIQADGTHLLKWTKHPDLLDKKFSAYLHIRLRDLVNNPVLKYGIGNLRKVHGKEGQFPMKWLDSGIYEAHMSVENIGGVPGLSISNYVFFNWTLYTKS